MFHYYQISSSLLTSEIHPFNLQSNYEALSSFLYSIKKEININDVHWEIQNNDTSWKYWSFRINSSISKIQMLTVYK